MRTPTRPLRATKTLTLASIALLVSSLSGTVNATDYDAPWETTLNEGKGQTVYFNAWGGGDRINCYLARAAKEISSKYDVTLEHVKIGDIAEVVSQVEAAKAVGRDKDGKVDLMWVNGEKFAAMKRNELTWGVFAPTTNRQS